MTVWRLPGDRGKYQNKTAKVDGYTFDSQAEAVRYQDLRLSELGGAVANLEVHPRFCLQEAFRDAKGKKHSAIYYEADFGYDEPGNPLRVIEDVKGAITAVFVIKMKLFLRLYDQVDFRLIRVERQAKPKKRGKR